MITVNELRISNDSLIIDIAIDSTLCASGQTCSITKVEIYNQTNYNSTTPLLTYNAGSSEFSDGNTKFSVTIPLDSSVPTYDELHNTDLFFIKVYWDGTPASDCPCGQDESPENFAVYNRQLVYQKGMQYLGELTNCCADKTGAVNFILTQKYFDLSLTNGAIVDAIDSWNKMMNNTSTVTTNNCGCHA